MDLSGGYRIYLFVLFKLFVIEEVWGTSVNVGPGITAMEGSTVILRCSFSKNDASVNSPPIVHWSILDADGYPAPILTRTNGETRTEPPYPRFSISGEADLRISNVQAEDNGKYRCRVQIIDDIPSEDFGDINLKVYWISKVVSTVPSTGIIMGNTVTMTCTVTGDLTPSVYWKKDDKELKLTSNSHVIKDDHSLVIHSVSRDDDGIYVCGARNNVREEMSTPKRLEVYYAPVISEVSDTKTVINQNVTVTFEVDSNPPAMLEWTKDGQPMDVDNNNPSFTFFVPEQEVGKSYELTLTATNSVGEMKRTTKVIIGDACGYTAISQEGSGRMVEAKTLSLKEGRSVALVCSVKDCDSSDTYSYEWYKNDVKYSTSDKLVINDASLMDDNMQYTCRVRGGIPFPSSAGFRIHIKVPLLEPITIVIICGCAAGFIFLIILIICCVCFCKKRRRTNGYKTAESKYSMQSGFSYNDIEFIGIKERRDDSSSTTSGIGPDILEQSNPSNRKKPYKSKAVDL